MNELFLKIMVKAFEADKYRRFIEENLNENLLNIKELNLYKLVILNKYDYQLVMETEFWTDLKPFIDATLKNLREAIRIFNAIIERNYLYNLVNKIRADLIETNKTSDFYLDHINSEIKLFSKVKKKANLGIDYYNFVIGIKTGEIKFYPTGLKDLDDLMYGFVKQELIIIAGRPGAGKTSLGLTIAYNQSFLYNLKVKFFSIEMGANAVLTSLLGISKSVPSWKVMKGMLNESEEYKLVEFINEFEKGNLEIETEINQIERIKSNILNSNADIFFIDYLQDIKCDFKTERENLNYAIQELKHLAKVINKPIVLLSQLNRASELNKSQRPSLRDLKGTGKIEEAGDKIILIHKAEEHSLILAKNKQGAIGDIPVEFRKDILRFV